VYLLGKTKIATCDLRHIQHKNIPTIIEPAHECATAILLSLLDFR
jgi:hypothetical protein